MRTRASAAAVLAALLLSGGLVGGGGTAAHADPDANPCATTVMSSMPTSLVAGGCPDDRAGRRHVVRSTALRGFPAYPSGERSPA